MCLFKAFVDFYLWSYFFLFSILFFNQHATFLDFKSYNYAEGDVADVIEALIQGV